MRAFLAITLPKRIKDKISAAQAALINAGADVSWVRPENFHLTVMFLAELTQEQLSRVHGAVDEQTRARARCALQWDRLGAFPSIEQPHIIWAGASAEQASALVRLVEGVRSSVRALGVLDEDRPFVPHATIGRVRSSKRLDMLRKSLLEESERWQPAAPHTVESIDLYESRLSAQGPAYRLLWQSRLAFG